jgi:hypothetical protein
LTFWELVQADVGRARAAWDHTAQLLAMAANVARGKGQKQYKPADFHPLRKSADADAGPGDLDAIREVLERCPKLAP